MFNAIEKWLIEKTKGPINKPLLAKIATGIFLTILAVITFIRYEVIRSSGDRAKLENALVKDDKADQVLKDKIVAIDAQVDQHLDVAKAAEKAAATDAKAVAKVDIQKKSDQAVINGLDSWDEVDRKIK